MKLYKIIISTLLALLVLNSCTDKFEEMNKNPWTSNDLDVKHIYTFTQLKMFSSGHEGWRANLIVSGPYAQNSSNIYTTATGFGINDSHTNTTWDLILGDVVRNIEDVRNRLEDGDTGKLAQLRIVRVVNFLRLTQLYGDIPYFNSGKGFTDLEYYPKLDPQKDILIDLAKELQEARDVLDGMSDADIFTYDLYDAGISGSAKYVKLANSLLMKIGLMMSEGDPTEGQRIFKLGFDTGKYISAWNDAVYVRHVSAGGPWGEHNNGTGIAIEGQVGGASYAFMSDLALQLMQGKQDPRLFRITNHLTYEGGIIKAVEDTTLYVDFDPFAAAGAEGTFARVHYRGLRLGDRSDGNRGIYHNSTDNKVRQAAYWVGHGDYYQDFANGGQFGQLAAVSPATFNRLTPSIVIGADEVQFMIAEANLRGYGVGDAAAAFEKGVTFAFAKFNSIGFPGSDSELKFVDLYKRQTNGTYDHTAAVANYISQAVIDFNAATDQLDALAYESWVSNIGDGYNSYANWNRTHLPSVVKYQLSDDDKTYDLPVFDTDPVLNPGGAQNGTQSTELHSFGVTEGVRPSRFPYPDRELTVNPAKVNEAMERQRKAAGTGASTNFIAVKQWFSKK